MARISRATLTSIKAKGSAAALTVTATTFGLSGFAAATSMPYSTAHYQPQGDWNKSQKHQPSHDSKQAGYNHNMHGDKKAVEHKDATKHDDKSYDQPKHEVKPVEHANWQSDNQGYQNDEQSHNEAQPVYNHDQNGNQPEYHEAVSEHHDNDNCPPENKGYENHQQPAVHESSHENQVSHESDKDCPPEDKGHGYQQSSHENYGQHSQMPAHQSASHDSGNKDDENCPPCPPEDSHNYGHEQNKPVEHSNDNGNDYHPSYESAYTNTEKTNTTTVNVSNTVNQAAAADSQSMSEDSWGGEVGDNAAGNNANVVTYVVVYNS